MKAVYSGLIIGLDNWELAETLLQLQSRAASSKRLVDSTEFVATDYETPPTQAKNTDQSIDDMNVPSQRPLLIEHILTSTSPLLFLARFPRQRYVLP